MENRKEPDLKNFDIHYNVNKDILLQDALQKRRKKVYGETAPVAI